MELPIERVLELIVLGRYVVNLSTGEIAGRGGKLLRPYEAGHQEGRDNHEYLWVRIYDHTLRRSVPVSHMVWMAGTKRLLPSDFEVHHRDEDRGNNRFDNLLALHYLDHRKLHAKESVNDIPF